MLTTLIAGLSAATTLSLDDCDRALARFDTRLPAILSEGNELVGYYNNARGTAIELRPALDGCLNDEGVIFQNCAARNLSQQIFEIQDQMLDVYERAESLRERAEEERAYLDNKCRGLMETPADHNRNLRIWSDLAESYRELQSNSNEIQSTLEHYSIRAGRLFGGRRTVGGPFHGSAITDETQEYASIAIPRTSHPRSEFIRRGEAYFNEGFSGIRVTAGTYDRSIYSGVTFPQNALRVALRQEEAGSRIDSNFRNLAPRIDFHLSFTMRDLTSRERFEISQPLLGLEFTPEMEVSGETFTPMIRISCRFAAGCIESIDNDRNLNEVVLPLRNTADLYERFVALQVYSYQELSTFDSRDNIIRADASYQYSQLLASGLTPFWEPSLAASQRMLGLSCLYGNTRACDEFEAVLNSDEIAYENALLLARDGCESGNAAMCEIYTNPQLNNIAGNDFIEINQLEAEECRPRFCRFVGRTQVGPSTYRSEEIEFGSTRYEIKVTIWNCNTDHRTVSFWRYDYEQVERHHWETETTGGYAPEAPSFCQEQLGSYTFAEAFAHAERIVHNY